MECDSYFKLIEHMMQGGVGDSAPAHRSGPAANEARGVEDVCKG